MALDLVSSVVVCKIQSHPSVQLLVGSQESGQTGGPICAGSGDVRNRRAAAGPLYIARPEVWQLESMATCHEVAAPTRRVYMPTEYAVLGVQKGRLKEALGVARAKVLSTRKPELEHGGCGGVRTVPYCQSWAVGLVGP